MVGQPCAAEFDQAEAAIERLRRSGHRVGMPLSRPLGRGLFELRFQCEGVARRVTFWYADWQPRLIVLLTTFRKQRHNERREVQRARSALEHCRARPPGMCGMTDRVSWDDLRSRQADNDPRTAAQRAASKAAASLRFDVAQLVYDLRTSAGLTQRQLAERMGTTQSVISRLEQAGRLPTLDLLARVATATGADLRLLARHAGGADLDVPLIA